MMMEHWRSFAQVRHFPVTRDFAAAAAGRAPREGTVMHWLCWIPRSVRARAAGTAVLAAVMSQPACSAGVEEFYKGKSISLIIGYSVGGGYDLYGRLLARHMGKYIPGRPVIVPQNLTGAGSLRAASFIYSAAPKDGTVFGTFGRTIATTPLLMPANAQLDATRLTWLGSITNEVSTCVTWHTSPVKNWKDSLE